MLKNKKILIPIVAVVLVACIGVAVLLLSGGKIQVGDFERISEEYTCYAVIGRDIGKMSNLEDMLDYLLDNEIISPGIYTSGVWIFDSQYCLWLQINTDGFHVYGVYENTGTARNPKQDDEVNDKTRELNQFIEKYNSDNDEKYKIWSEG